MKIITTPMTGLILIEPHIFSDERGFFYETCQQERYAQYGIPAFLQDNVSRSKKNVLRGLHYQQPKAQGKLIWVSKGAIWDVALDIRSNSNTFGQWFSTVLSDESHTQIYIPPGFAHGFCVLSDEADIYYKCTEYYAKEAERGIIWNDAHLNIPWPVKNPLLSAKDKLLPSFEAISHAQLVA